ncbi:hypothetical protein R3P38DRAFT_1962055 [Favolaschia claudopus]|uniref:Uncharacterized protein n=1 Tax=Favolaschia claudopus TaxID=2862362 RepID=A0AAV9ZYV7_9AGAR
MLRRRFRSQAPSISISTRVCDVFAARGAARHGGARSAAFHSVNATRRSCGIDSTIRLPVLGISAVQCIDARFFRSSYQYGGETSVLNLHSTSLPLQRCLYIPLRWFCFCARFLPRHPLLLLPVGGGCVLPPDTLSPCPPAHVPSRPADTPEYFLRDVELLHLRLARLFLSGLGRERLAGRGEFWWIDSCQRCGSGWRMERYPAPNNFPSSSLHAQLFPATTYLDAAALSRTPLIEIHHGQSPVITHRRRVVPALLSCQI